MAVIGPVAPSIAAAGNVAQTVPAVAGAAGAGAGLLSGLSGLASAAVPLLGLASGAVNAVGQALGGNAESGTKGNASFGGIQIGSKVVGSGTATTIPAPENPTQAAVYSQVLPTGSGSIPANLLPLAGIIAVAVLLFALIMGTGSSKGKKRKGS